MVVTVEHNRYAAKVYIYYYVQMLSVNLCVFSRLQLF